ncbi:MAG: glycosyltransferase family 39 protein [Candidatus Coatesbacteria bacterium]|nr:glycosyltransferase family 39 protein [Candidatus Coatesbacteria bacterium]
MFYILLVEINMASGSKTKRILLYKEIIIIFAIALIVRLFVTFEIKDNPYFNHPVIDAGTYHERAIEIADGKLIEKLAFWQAPGYPYFLGFIYFFIGAKNFLLLRIIQSIIGSLTCVLLFLLGKQIFEKRIAYISAIILSFYPTIVFLDLEILNPVLENFLLLLFFYLLYLAREKQKMVFWGLAGLAAGLLSITRGSIILFVLVFIIFSFLHKHKFHSGKKHKTETPSYPILTKRSFYRFFPMFIFPILLTTAHNYYAEKVFIPVCSNNGMNFYIGNNPDYISTVGLRPGYEWELMTLEPKHKHGYTKSDDLSNYWMKKGFDFYLNNPLAALRLLRHKIFLLLRGHEILRNQNIYAFRKYSQYLKYTLFKIPGFLSFPLGILYPFAFVGLFLTLHNWRKLLLIYFFIMTHILFVLAFFVTARYRLPLIPFLILFSVSGLIMLYSERKDYKRIAISVSLLLGIFIVSNFKASPMKDEQDYASIYNLGWFYQCEGKHAKAESLYYEVLKQDPNYVSALLNLSVILSKYQNKAKEALFYAEKLIELHPNHLKAQRNRVLILYSLNKYEKAIDYSLELIERFPKDKQSRDNLFWGLRRFIDICVRKKEYRKAEKYLLIYKQLEPENADIDTNLKVVRSLLQESQKD